MDFQMRRVVILAGGEVQGVGYREYIKKETFRKNITGFVQNLKTGDVEILAEGEEENLTVFLDAINVSEYPIDVRDFRVTWLDASGEYKRFTIVRGDKDEELFERIDVAVSLLNELVENTTISLEKQDQMLGK